MAVMAKISAGVQTIARRGNAFDMMNPDEENSRKVLAAFDAQFDYAVKNY